MALKHLKFPETRAWVICHNFNQRSTRIIRDRQRSKSVNVIHSLFWNQASRRIYRYFFYRTFEASRQSKSSAISSPWALRIQGLIRELRRRSRDYRELWRRRIFQILEVLSQIPKPPSIDPAWQSCAQILTAPNNWRRRYRSVSLKPPTWTNVMWRAAHLNTRTQNPVQKPDWQVRYRIIAATSFRKRALGWNRTYVRIAQAL